MLTHFWSVLLPFPLSHLLLPSPLPKVSRKCFCFLLFSIFHLPFSISYFNMSLNWACYLCKPSDTLCPQSRQFSVQPAPLPPLSCLLHSVWLCWKNSTEQRSQAKLSGSADRAEQSSAGIKHEEQQEGGEEERRDTPYKYRHAGGWRGGVARTKRAK